LTEIEASAAGAGTTDTKKPGRVSLNHDALVDTVYAGFSARNRERITRDDVVKVVADLKLDEHRPMRHSLALRVRRLKLSGEKRLRDRAPEPFVYDQAFAPGVNVLCILDNDVGKSSILKAIKYALTGDDDDFDADVRSWITDIWLGFALDQQAFTVLLSNRDGTRRALLVPGDELRPIETTGNETTLAIFDVAGMESIKAELQRFFFQRLGLGPLSWTQRDVSLLEGVTERSTSWLTYFQALEIPDVGDRYLLCDPQHAMGNQDGLILSAFLGLHLVEPLNQLGLEASRARKEVKLKEQLTTEQVQRAKEQLSQLEAEIQSVRARLREIDTAHARRREAVEGGEPAQRLIATQSALVEKASEQAHLESEREELNRTLQRRRARERQLREAIALRLHFTGLEVSLCPNCDANVETEAVEREQTDHLCRLCGLPAQSANPAEVEALNAEAQEIRGEIADMAKARDAITTRLATLHREIEDLRGEINSLMAAAQQGIAYALPSPEENVQRNQLYEQIGRLQAESDMARRRAESPPSQEENEIEIRVRVVEKVRESIRDEAAALNRELLERLSALTQEVARTIGAESVSDVSCSPLGKVELRKHGERVSFTGIHNVGERLRIKLAFFLAMMRLGREPGLGRHPGFLLVDQPGSGEMVAEDFTALADVFHRVDGELASEVQIICCTARREFEAATAPEKVYGPQNLPYAF
jgi:hypothetical protein